MNIRPILLAATAALVLGWATGCAEKLDSPRIYCEIKGKPVATAFTFKGFEAVLRQEHGSVKAIPNVSLESSRARVSFKLSPDGKLVVTEVLTLATQQQRDPAAFFGLSSD
jgi:hypothetical protein